MQSIDRQNTRMEKARQQISLSFCAKVVSVLTTLFVVPITINYINPTQYGIWMTISSIISWVLVFDLGIGSGFRNKYASAKAIGDELLAQKYVSTAYFSICIVSVFILCVAAGLNQVIYWPSLLNLEDSYQEELKSVFFVLSIFLCLNLVVSLFPTLLVADQNSGLANIITCIGQLLSLFSIWIMTKTVDGSLKNLALFFSGVPCLFVLIVSIFFFSFSKYREVRPRFSLISLKMVKDIVSLGVVFFIIAICQLVIFQIVNLVLSREINPEAVTQYNVSFKYFNLLYGVMIIVINPFWTAFTEAYVQKDKQWMIDVRKKLENIWIISVLMGIMMLLFSPLAYKVWIGSSVTIPFSVSLSLFFYVCCQNIGNIYMYLINGIGTIKLQMYIYIVLALFSWPLMSWGGEYLGIVGVVAVPTIAYLLQAIVAKIQLNKLIEGQATGVWKR